MIRHDKMMDKILSDIDANVKKHGQSVVYVGRIERDTTEPFHYTVGRHSRGLPELLMTALTNPESGMLILNALDRAMPKTLPSGSKVDIGGTFPLMIINATNDIVKREYTLIASRYYDSDDYQVQQVVYPDKNGIFPNDPRCVKPYSAQVLLGEVT